VCDLLTISKPGVLVRRLDREANARTRKTVPNIPRKSVSELYANLIERSIAKCHLHAHVGIAPTRKRHLLFLDDGDTLGHPCIRRLGSQTIERGTKCCVCCMCRRSNTYQNRQKELARTIKSLH